MIRLLVIEDHKTFISGLRYDIRANRHEISVAIAAKNLDEAFNAHENEFDIILLDLLLPNTKDPVRNLNLLKDKFPNKPIIILTSETRAVWEIKMKKAGAYAFFTKHDEINDLIEGIKNAYNGDNQKNMDFKEYPKKDIWTGRLKPREKAILEKIADRKTYAEIADDFGLSLKLVYKITSRLRKKYNVSTNLGLLKYFKIRI